MNALGKTWHPEHFFCTLCGKHFGDEGFHEKDGKAYCQEDYYEKFAPKCNHCKRAIMESFITALRYTWHPECFNCLVSITCSSMSSIWSYDTELHSTFGHSKLFGHDLTCPSKLKFCISIFVAEKKECKEFKIETYLSSVLWAIQGCPYVIAV